MYQKMNQFVSRFRDLEQKEFTLTGEEERRWKMLKEKLAVPQLAEPSETISRKCIAVTSLYAQAGASFISGNIAYAWAGKGVPVTLCERPNAISYFYFALDYERRAKQRENTSTSQLLMQNNYLRIQMESPLNLQQKPSSTDIASWLLRVSKDSPIVIIDISSGWTEDETNQMFEMADEIWVVFDADLARLTRLFLTEAAPIWWTTQMSKLRFIANKWNNQLAKSSVMKKVEGTLSLWNSEFTLSKVECMLPLIDGERTATAHSKGNLLLESFPEEESEFQSLIPAYKGRML
ncbi:hypothetical protein [Brevibacillus reuszeri]|uniref:hypothetical protein n=1 Tax=Brevibacillus reuszeri TaxID=54915 RepID=UPI00289D9A4F|nr:hypothetical protein [Brevibacillus reuszeri]